MQKLILKIQTQDKIGIMYEVTKVLLKYEVNIEKNSEYVDKENKLFFMRVEFSGTIFLQCLVRDIKALFNEGAIVELHTEKKKKVVILVTKESHCLGDILLRYDNNELNIEILGVISNHNYLCDLTNKFNIPYYHIPVNELTREGHEELVLEKLQEILPEDGIDYLILAKYMRILTPKIVQEYSNIIINIHHSFLPAFIGANPYKQAYDRGVKIIGATAHFVTDNLDEGPIISQGINHIDHTLSVHELKLLGADIEKITLSSALSLVMSDRVFINKNKTIIF